METTKKPDYFRIYYKVGKSDIEFSYSTPYLNEAYEAVKAIINRESFTAFPNVAETLSEYFIILSNIATGKTLSHENHIFRIEGK